MKKFYFIFSFVVLAFIFSSCCGLQVGEYKTQIYVPVYKSLDEIRSGVSIQSPRELEYPGKIYIFGRYIFLNEKGEGIHIIDNQDPKNPAFLSFIEIPGNGDMAVKNNILYADSYIDLLAFDISSPTKPTLVKRIEGIFPNPLDRNDQYLDPEKGLLVEWLLKDTVIHYTYNDCNDYSTAPVYVDKGRNIDFGGGLDVAESGGGTPSGKGGSMARLTIYGSYMYSVDRTNLQTFDISNPSDPKPWAKVNIGWNIETIYPFKDKLFIGSMTGMFIYDVSTPWNPVLIGQFIHARACDPVVADEEYAYVTLRTGTRCGGAQNQLDVLDIRDLTKPKLLKSYPMQEPAGLGIDGINLFICDGIAGLKIFDRTKPLGLKLLSWTSNLHTYDIIPMGSYALVVGDDGLYQYDYTDPKNIVLLSKIPIKAK